jgi:anti-sigma factor RsiW
VGFSTHLRCDQLVEIASDYLERALSAEDAERLEQHLVICGACAEYIAQIRAVRDAAQRLVPEGEPGLDAAGQQALRALLVRIKRGGAP